MNKSFLFSLATSSEPMQVTWKMNDEGDLICIRQMNESFTSRPCLRVNERSGGERFVHLPDTDLRVNVSFFCQPSLRINDSFICRIQIRFSSSFIFHKTCIGSALLARENRNDSFILTGSSDTDFRIIFLVTCAQKRKQKGFVYLVHFRVARFSKT